MAELDTNQQPFFCHPRLHDDSYSKNVLKILKEIGQEKRCGQGGRQGRRKPCSISQKVGGNEKFMFINSGRGWIGKEEEKHSPKWKTCKARSAILAAFSDQTVA